MKTYSIQCISLMLQNTASSDGDVVAMEPEPWMQRSVEGIVNQAAELEDDIITQPAVPPHSVQPTDQPPIIQVDLYKSSQCD